MYSHWSITGPVITREGESPKRRVNNLETREKLGLNKLPKPDSRTNEPLPESADAYQKIEMEKAKQGDGLADLSDLLVNSRTWLLIWELKSKENSRI
ncbi:hypothetical protein Bca52824_077246 [Brassica carinata]|uniref:Uncharacterized protein n=1 Tax=Brassica carinata TaxID=52824 RepID=A0A8X7PWC8_BRACI|nr:hypothetical protein Bca52824_077246 [Brassica carinata]